MQTKRVVTYSVALTSSTENYYHFILETSSSALHALFESGQLEGSGVRIKGAVPGIDLSCLRNKTEARLL